MVCRGSSRHQVGGTRTQVGDGSTLRTLKKTRMGREYLTRARSGQSGPAVASGSPARGCISGAHATATTRYSVSKTLRVSDKLKRSFGEREV